jgi:hypothetical protein
MIWLTETLSKPYRLNNLRALSMMLFLTAAR